MMKPGFLILLLAAILSGCISEKRCAERYPPAERSDIYVQHDTVTCVKDSLIPLLADSGMIKARIYLVAEIKARTTHQDHKSAHDSADGQPDSPALRRRARNAQLAQAYRNDTGNEFTFVELPEVTLPDGRTVPGWHAMLKDDPDASYQMEQRNSMN